MEPEVTVRYYKLNDEFTLVWRVFADGDEKFTITNNQSYDDGVHAHLDKAGASVLYKALASTVANEEAP